MKKIVISDVENIKQWKDEIVIEFQKYNEVKFELIYKSDFANNNIIRDFISFVCEKVGIDYLIKFKIILIIDELNSNAIEYWSKSWENNKIRMHVTKTEKDFVINLELEDTWNWNFAKSSNEMYWIEKQKIKTGFKNNKTIRWRWLLIIKSIVDKLYFKDSITWWLIVWIDYKFKI